VTQPIQTVSTEALLVPVVQEPHESTVIVPPVSVLDPCQVVSVVVEEE